jgi:hypothetical protein
MLYRLQLSKTFEGLVRVTASIGRSSEYVIAIYEDEETLLYLVRHAGLCSSTVTILENMVASAFSSLGRRACCEEVELNNDQLRVLQLRAVLQLIA